MGPHSVGDSMRPARGADTSMIGRIWPGVRVFGVWREASRRDYAVPLRSERAQRVKRYVYTWVLPPLTNYALFIRCSIGQVPPMPFADRGSASSVVSQRRRNLRI